MKARMLKASTLAVVLATVLSVSSFAQRGQGNGQGQGYGRQQMDLERPRFEPGERMAQMLDLTEAQQAQIDELRTAHLKEMQVFRNKMGELRAKQRTLSTGDNVDLKTVNANIDEITALQNTMMKAREAHHQDVREILTEEQRVIFDSNKGFRQGRGMRGDGFGRGNGRGYARGNCRF